jgi:prolyl-tRNA editing enzyme YbaK/EbsC (Cys-tRNA(Pro) deacylase)
VLIDPKVFENAFILLDAGTHGESIRLRPGDLLSLAYAEVVSLAQEPKEDR